MRRNVKARSTRMPMTTVVTIPAIVPGRSDDGVVWSLVVAVNDWMPMMFCLEPYLNRHWHQSISLKVQHL